MKKLISILISFALLLHISPAVSAKSKGDWGLIKDLLSGSNAVAVKTRKGATHYGLLESADDSSITLRIAGRDEMTAQTINLRRDEVARVWRARLRFDEDNVGKATWIGAGAGVAVVGAVIAASHEAEDAPAGAAFIVMIGAGAGAVLGRFWKKKHKKEALVYSI